jgi:hypothetical protein
MAMLPALYRSMMIYLQLDIHEANNGWEAAASGGWSKYKLVGVCRLNPTLCQTFD